MHTKANPLFKALRVFIQSYFHSTEIKTHVIHIFLGNLTCMNQCFLQSISCHLHMKPPCREKEWKGGQRSMFYKWITTACFPPHLAVFTTQGHRNKVSACLEAVPSDGNEPACLEVSIIHV